jgi:hypothetical protein
MRNLEISESGSLSLEKEAAFLERYRLYAEGAIVPGASTPVRTSEAEIVRQSVLLLQGIPSEKAFELDQHTFTFKLHSRLHVESLCNSKESLN